MPYGKVLRNTLTYDDYAVIKHRVSNGMNKSVPTPILDFDAPAVYSLYRWTQDLTHNGNNRSYREIVMRSTDLYDVLNHMENQQPRCAIFVKGTSEVVNIDNYAFAISDTVTVNGDRANVHYVIYRDVLTSVTYGNV